MFCMVGSIFATSDHLESQSVQNIIHVNWSGLFLFLHSRESICYCNDHAAPTWECVGLIHWLGWSWHSILLAGCILHELVGYDGSIMTVITNRFGDLLIFFFVGWLLLTLRFDYSRYIPLALLVCYNERAQVPFSRWLPMAMRAPTPVSSLVHSSTLVTAGIMLLIMQAELLTSFTHHLLLAAGLITAFIGGIFIFSDVDIKKNVALSTLSTWSNEHSTRIDKSHLE